MTFAEMNKLNKDEISWYSFISGLSQYKNNRVESIKIESDRFYTVKVNITNMNTLRPLIWKYRFNYCESDMMNHFVDRICSEFPDIEVFR